MLFINFIFALAAAGVVAAQDTSATISGIVRGPEDARIPLLSAELAMEGPPYTLFSVRMDQEGGFKFSVLPAGTYTLTMAHTGFKTLKVKSIVVASAEQKILPSLKMEAAPTDSPELAISELELRSTDVQFGNLSGRVVRVGSRALAGAIVTLFCDDKLSGRTTTDGRCEFVFLNLPAADGYALSVTHPGYFPWQRIDYEVQAGYDSTYGPIVLAPRVRTSRAPTTVR